MARALAIAAWLILGPGGPTQVAPAQNQAAPNAERSDPAIRFIRLEYDGEGWDTGMGKDGGDARFLASFQEVTGFRTAKLSESHAIDLLDDYPAGFAPPFVYLTGDKTIELTGGQQRVLRQYLLGGGMLIADPNSEAWAKSFKQLTGDMFPDKRLANMADDDPLFMVPYRFNDGPPIARGYGGDQCMGAKHEGRWIIFIHPGGLNEAWQKGEIQGLDASRTAGSIDLGVNVLYYAFTNYLKATRHLRTATPQHTPDDDEEASEQ
jgi:hypothetical protein